jgi:uncharacterized membrane protein
MSKSLKLVLVAVVAILGVLALATGIVYLVVPFRHLPSFIPGHKPGYGAYHKRGVIAVVIALVLLVAAGLVARVGRRSRRSSVPPGVDEASGAPSLPVEESAGA